MGHPCYKWKEYMRQNDIELKYKYFTVITS